MKSGPARLLLTACSTLILVACGSVARPPAGTGLSAGTSPPATRAPLSAYGTPAPGSCGSPPPRHAWAVEVTRTGLIGWKTPLATGDSLASQAIPPVPAGLVAVLTDQVSNHAG